MHRSASLILKMVWVGVWNAYQNESCHFPENRIFLFPIPRTSNPTTWFHKKSINIVNSVPEDTSHEGNATQFYSRVSWNLDTIYSLPSLSGLFPYIYILLKIPFIAGCHTVTISVANGLANCHSCKLVYRISVLSDVHVCYFLQTNLRMPYQYIIHVAYFDRKYNARVVWHYIV